MRACVRVGAIPGPAVDGRERERGRGLDRWGGAQMNFSCGLEVDRCGGGGGRHPVGDVFLL